MKIILSADDFAKTHERNIAIDQAIKGGMIKSVALIMGSEFTDEAIELAIGGGYIKEVHCHLNIVSASDVDTKFLPLSTEYIHSKFGRLGSFPLKYNYLDYFSPEFYKIIYCEMERQYLEFIKVTDGKANYNHIDVHKYMNMFPAVAVAYRNLIKKYHIRSARYYGEHHKKQKQYKQKLKFCIANLLGGNKANVMKSCNVDYYITLNDLFQKEEVVELYVHPDYKNGILIDNTVSALGHEIVPLNEQIKALMSTGDIELLSWADFNSIKNKF